MRTVQVTRRSTVGVFGLCATVGTLAFGSDAEAKVTYTILPAGYIALSINDSGAVAGGESGAGFIRTPDGTITTFHAPGDTFGTVAVSINADNEIAGFYVDNNDVRHGFVRTADGSITTFDAPGAGNTAGHGTTTVGINQVGTVIGTYPDSSEIDHSFIRTADGNITEIKVTGADDTQAKGINDKGAIAGQYDRADGEHGFVRTAGGNVKKFDVPGDNLATFVQCINSKSAIAGNYVDGSRVLHGFIRAADGTFEVFDAPGPNVLPTGLNAKGTVVGVYELNRKGIGFLRKPDGSIEQLHVPGAQAGVESLSINASGVIAGYFLVRVSKNVYEPYGFIRTP